jgi:exopolysaccharide biosynthesis protein
MSSTKHSIRQASEKSQENSSEQNVKEVFGFEIREGAEVNEDLLEELSIHDPDAEVDKDGNITVYHRTAILSKGPETNHWLLTAWDNKEETAVYATREVRDSLGATAVTPTLNRRSGVNTTVSNNSIPTSEQNVKEVFGFEIREGAEVNEDLLEELSIHDPDAAVDKNGNITVYHRTTAENAKKIYETGVMTANCDNRCL